MPTFKNMKDLERHVNKLIKQSLETDVAEKVKDTMQSNIQKEVYDAYESGSNSPEKYDRRYDDNGLGDRGNIDAKVDATNTLVVENVTRGADTGMLLAGLIEYGHNKGYGSYDYPWIPYGSRGNFMKPRPFISETFNEIKRKNLHIQSLKQGLKKLGLNVR